MPTRNKLVKQETRVPKIKSRRARGRLKETESHARGRAIDTKDASQVFGPSGGQSRRDSTPKVSARKPTVVREVTPYIQWIPVVSKTGKPLMPTRHKRVRQLMKAGKAVGKWKVGIFYIRLTEREDGEVQPIAVGVDPGSKREGFTVKSNKHTYLNILSDAVTDVKKKMKTRRQAKRSRRFRKTPCRANRNNRAKGGIPPSTKARWQAKLRIINILASVFPVDTWVVEDIKAKSPEGKRRWNASFSPLEVGKEFFYNEVRKYGKLVLKSGWDTKCMRDELGLVKTNGKMEEKFSAHNVDSWVLAHSVVGGKNKSDNETVWRLIPLRFHKRQLQRFQPATGGIRERYGSTMSLGFKRGSLVKQPKWGLCYIGGNAHGMVNLHDLGNGKIVHLTCKKKDLKVLRFGSWRYRKAIV